MTQTNLLAPAVSHDLPVTQVPQQGPTAEGAQPAIAGTMIAWVSWVKVLAILAVISTHNSGSTAAAARKAADGVRGLFGVATDLPFVVAVPLFIMVSGALSLNPNKFRSSGAYLRKRSLRLVPAIVFWHAFYLLLFWTTNPYFSHSPTSIFNKFITGKLASHLYFFWIVLGLSLITPVLIRWIRDSDRKEWIIGGLLACSIPILSVGTLRFRGTIAWVETPWSLWVPYVGLFILGYALRDVILTRWRLGAAAAGWVGLSVLFCWQWLHPQTRVLRTLVPISYYSATNILAAVLCFLVLKSLLREGGALKSLVQPRVMTVINSLSNMTLGIFGLHLALVYLFIKWETFGPAATTAAYLLARYAAVVVMTTGIVVLWRKIPYLRAVV